MYAHIEGTVCEKAEGLLVLDAHGVGYAINVTQNALAAAPPLGQSYRVYTRLLVREDAMELVGFCSQEERRMFDKLTGVTGIGTKVAMSVLSAMSVANLSLALATGDAASLKRLPGIGAKMAQRMILELREKVSQDELMAASPGVALPTGESGDASAEAIQALASLGYTSSEAARAVMQARAQSPEGAADDLIRLALRRMDLGR